MEGKSEDGTRVKLEILGEGEKGAPAAEPRSETRRWETFSAGQTLLALGRRGPGQRGHQTER